MPAGSQGPTLPVRGISEALARDRAEAISDLCYDLTFSIPDAITESVLGSAVLRFTLASPRPVVLDFAPPPERVRRVTAGGRPVDVRAHDGHLIVPQEATVAGVNEIGVAFVAGDEALNRREALLYTLFVPARAHLAFPAFDQPDLKGRVTLTLEVPADWEAVANGADTERTAAGPGRTRITFAETPPLPTYLVAFAAGRFQVEHASRDGRAFRMFHLETDAEQVARNRDTIVDLHAAALTWLEDYTAIPYPFSKFDIVLIPAFQFSGMEHPGAILYNASRLLLDESATQNQRLDRASLIAHETAHMWFGDLVTMRWFDDVWMKEVFASFMAAKIVDPLFPEVNHELRFLLAHYPGAYQVDRTAGANPIRQPLANLDEAGQLYGPIIYQKAPIVMRQLEILLGPEALRDGLREYLRAHALGNASWPDLVRLLDARTPLDLVAWSRAWVEERGRPELKTTVHLDRDGRLSGITLTMTDPLGRGFVWPQRLRVALGYPGVVRLVDVDVAGPSTLLDGVAGMPRPLYVLPNGAGLGYGLFRLDEESRDYLLGHIGTLPDALTRGSAWVTLWDAMLEGEVTPAAFFETALRALLQEDDEQNSSRVLGYVTRVFWRFLAPEIRPAFGGPLETVLRVGLARAATTSGKSAWFATYREIVLSAEGLAWLARVWHRDERVPGLPLAESDAIVLAFELAVREAPGWQDILREQAARTVNPDRRAQLAFVMPALSADPAERERSFARFRDVEQRRREPWVLEALRCLNHPLRAAHAERFVRPALDLLIEIQRTGDIFFPARWLESMLWGHRSPGAAAIVRTFLAEHPEYPERLRWTILSAADELFRAADV